MRDYFCFTFALCNAHIKNIYMIFSGYMHVISLLMYSVITSDCFFFLLFFKGDRASDVHFCETAKSDHITTLFLVALWIYFVKSSSIDISSFQN